MSPLPTTDLSGFSELKSRISGAFDMLQEARSLDFKKAIPWDEIKIDLTKDILAMSNLRDGGILILGVEEVNDNWELKGVSAETLETYDSDDMHDFVNRYASPTVSFDVVTHSDDSGLTYLVVQVHEFEDRPIVCKRNGDGIREGAFYIRPLGKPETREVQDANEIHDILELAVEKNTKRFLYQIKKVGVDFASIQPQESDSEKYDKELGGL